MRSKLFSISVAFLFLFLTAVNWKKHHPIQESPHLRIEEDQEQGTLKIHKDGFEAPILIQNAQVDFRPFIHPLRSPDGKKILTEYSPGHHPHQTGIYWGITRINGRDYFHNPNGDYWKRVSYSILEKEGTRVSWQTVYDLLDAEGESLLTETQTWSLTIRNNRYYLQLEWQGDAQQDLTFAQYDYGGLFVRMPWKPGTPGQVVNAARQVNEKAEGQPAMWVDVGLQLERRDLLDHIAIFDHPQNRAYPQLWRVDGQMGIGTAKARHGEWKLAKGTSEIVRHQLVVYSGPLDDVGLNEDWIAFSGKGSTSDLWGLAREEGRQAKFLTPEEAVKAMTVKEGFKVNVWSAEPTITQPMAFCWDDKGRLWVAENRDYESRGHGFSNSGDSRILILEDTDGDGVADARKVFAEGIAFPAALAVGFDGVFVGAPPNLLFIPDRNKDDKADMDAIEIRLTGWGIRDRHETLNSLHWGPDGWLYGAQGFATPSTVGKPIGKGKVYKGKEPYPDKIEVQDGQEINGGVWRYHPTKDIFEVVAHGFSNPWGIDYDAKGQLFITACVIPHLWHIIPGGIYHRQGGQHFNPYHYSDIRTIADHSHRSAHGGARIYQSDAFPEEQRGRIFMANIHEHAVLSDILVRNGSGFIGKHGDDFLLANNAQWVGFSIEIGPDGNLYVLDWHDADICGSEVLHKETGRIFRISPDQSLAENWQGRYEDLNRLSDRQLVELQTSKSDWHTRRARVILQYRASQRKLDPEAITYLKNLFAVPNPPDHRLKALWSLHITKSLSENDLLKALVDQDEYIRAWAIQLLCEDDGNKPAIITALSRMAQSDTSAVVRLYLASVLQRLKPENRWAILDGLVRHKIDNQDHNIPKMIWFGLEPLAAAEPEKAMSLALKSNLTLPINYIARRILDAGKLETLLHLLPKSDHPATLHLLAGIKDGLDTQPDTGIPSNWDLVYQRLKTGQPAVRQLATEIAQKFGDNETVAQQITLLKNRSTPVEERKKAILTLAAKQRHELVALLPDLLKDASVRIEAIRAVAAYNANQLGRQLLNDYPTYSNTEKAEAIMTLSSRPSYGGMLTRAIADESIPRKDVPVYAARQLLRVVGSGFVEVWGPIEQQNVSLRHEYERYRRLLTDKTLQQANLSEGKLLFARTCGPCHKMYGEGGDLGPDITGSNRTNLDYLLTNILEPSADIQDDYKMVVITTRDGRTYAGNIASENIANLTLKVVGQDPVVIAKSTIQSREVTPVSMMPPGLLESLSEAEIVNLIAYLQKATR